MALGSRMVALVVLLGLTNAVDAQEAVPAPAAVNEPEEAPVLAHEPAANAEAALHGRCISGGVGRHSVATGGNEADAQKCENPCESKGLGINRRHLSKGGKLEAAGIEPASCDPLASASTCVGRRLLSPAPASTNRARRQPATTSLAPGKWRGPAPA